MTLPAQSLARWVQALRAGQVLVCPTETQYGLLADASNPLAVAAVSTIKRRPATEPIALIVPQGFDLHRIASAVPPVAIELADLHWPGALTLLLPARPDLPAALVREGKVGVRVPGESPALELVNAYGGALTATSANRSGQPPVESMAAARAEFGSEVFDVVPGEPGGGPPSTLVDITQAPLRVLRRGPIEVDVDP